jgi:hypothetical protein
MSEVAPFTTRPLRLTLEDKEALADAAYRKVLAFGPGNLPELVRALHRLEDNLGIVRSEW